VAIHVPLQRRRSEELPLQVERVEALIRDIPATIRLFPELRRIVELGSGAYRWELEPLGTAVYKVPITFANRFTVSGHFVKFVPIPEVGNARIGGALSFEALGGGTRFSLTVEGRILLPLPLVLKPVAAPVVASEFERLVDGFAANILRAVG